MRTLDRSPWVGRVAVCCLLGGCLKTLAAADAPQNQTDGAGEQPPAVGQTAPDFELATPEGQPVKLSEVLAQGPVVLVFLRGFPGYQCPLCSLQVADLVRNASAFAEKSARVVLVYPGPAAELSARAKEFTANKNKNLPENITLVVDPDFLVTNAYHLRWDAPRETAYPSTFVLDQQGQVRFAVVSKTHAGRPKASDLLSALVAK